jgi:hypothetical protein
MAKDFVYADFEFNVIPDEAYLQSRMPLLEARITLAGARLALLIDDIYGDDSNNLFTQ